MAATIAPASLKSLLEGKSPFALIDVREAGEYNSSHIPGREPRWRAGSSSSLVTQAVPFKGTQVVVCDDDGRRAALAARTLERLGYRPGVGARRRHQPLGDRRARRPSGA